MDFRILGPLEVSENGRTVPIRGRKLQALLALLLLNAGEVVPRERLIDELWGDDPPPTAAKTLQVHVSRLRRELGDAVVTSGGGYLIRVDPGGLDLERFVGLVEEGRRALAAGDPMQAEARLSEALALWRGQPFAELGDEEFARVEGQRLADLRLDALEERIEAELALGHSSEAIPELEKLIARHPYRERPRAQLMLALYREGRQAEALSAYAAARKTLVEDLGIEPGPRLRELHAAILEQDPALDAAKPAAAPAVDGAPAPAGRPRDLRPLLAAGALALAVAALLVLLLTGGEGEDGPALTRESHAVVAIDPSTNEVTDAAQVGSRPGAIAFEPESRSLWVANFDDHSVTRIDTNPFKVGRTVAVEATPWGLAAASGSVWVATVNRAQSFVTLREIDPGFDSIGRSVRIPAPHDGTADVAREGNRLWVAPSLGLLTPVDSRSARARRALDPGGAAPSSVAAGAGALWVTDDFAGTVSRVDADSGVVRPIPVGNRPAGVAVGAGSVWVTLSLDDKVARLDPETGAVRDTIAVGDRPTGIAAGRGGVWVAGSDDGTLTRIDPRSGDVSATIDVGASPQDVALSGDRVWVSVRPRVAQPASRQGATLRVLAGPQDDPEQFTLDPALGYWYLTWQIQQATCAKLINYSDRPGPRGSRLRPEVAEALPERSADGLTYTFRIRSGYRFSPPSGEPVTAQSFKHAIERAYHPRMRSPLQDHGVPIAGVEAYRVGRARHISGIRADGDTLTIRLTAPLNDLPTWLAMPFFCPVPEGTPINPEGVRELPSAGPYYIASEEPEEGVVLRRNPYYSGPRPQRVAEIDIEVPVAPEEAVARVEAGTADFATDAIGPAAARRLAARYERPRYRVDRSLGTDYLLFNLRRPAFSSLRLRRAVNYAIDRQALAEAGGILLGLPARPTDQYVPPGMPGFEDAHVYPLEPDLSRARALAGSRQRVVRLYTPAGTSTEQLAEIVRANLREIGIDVQVTTIKSFDVFARPNEPWDLALISWYADRHDPIDFLRQFDGRLLAQGPFPNMAGFAEPAYDRRLEAANSLTGTERYLALGRLDGYLARTWAPFAAFSNETRHSLFSERVGCQVHNPVTGIDLAALCIREEE